MCKGLIFRPFKSECHSVEVIFQARKWFPSLEQADESVHLQSPVLTRRAKNTVISVLLDHV